MGLIDDFGIIAIGIYIVTQILLIGIPCGVIKKLNDGILTEESCRKAYYIFVVCFVINLFTNAVFGFVGCFIVWLPARIILTKSFRKTVHDRIEVLSNIPKGTSYEDVKKISRIDVAYNGTIELKMPYSNGNEDLKLCCYFDENGGYDSYSTGGLRVTYYQQ